jgi:hypothetical protein
MLTRRGLFSLIPAPLAECGGGLLSTRAELPRVPSSDPVAVAAMALGMALEQLDAYPGVFRHMRALPSDQRLLSPRAVDAFEREQLHHARLVVDAAETDLRLWLRDTPGVRVVLLGREYGRGLRVTPVEVALLAPKGGAS